MTAMRWRMWSAALAAGAISACDAPVSDEPPPPAPVAAALSQPAGEGGEAGEAGAADAYAGIVGETRAGLRVLHLKGFALLGVELARAGRAAEGGIVLQQGILEVADPAPGELFGLDVAALRAQAQAGELEAALARIAAAEAAAPPADPDRIRRMLAITRGLYSVVNAPEGVDPIEYQHSLGAALAVGDGLKRMGAREALAEWERLRALWPALDAPETPHPNADVAAQAARVELALPPG